VAAPDRAADATADARRHPAEVLSFSGVKAGDAVAELIPGSGYFTRIFSKVVGPRGHVYAVWPDEYAKLAHPDPENSLILSRTRGYRNITVLRQPARAFATPRPVDLVFTAQNYHDYPDRFMGRVDPAIFDRAVFKALRPGGVFLIVDHVAAAGSGMRDTDTLHRIDPATVKAQVVATGFTFVGSINVLRNPADDHTKAVFDPAVRGRTDQFVMKFRKP
jgi:predicted methyltransferase